MDFNYKYTGPVRNYAADDVTIKIKQSDFVGHNGPDKLESQEVGNLLNVAYFLAGIVAVIVIIYGGVRYVTANGDPNNVKSAKNAIMYAVVGLVVVMMAAAMTQFVITYVGK